jgi:hypothetical protein
MATMQLSQEHLQLVSEVVAQRGRLLLLLVQLGLVFSTTTTTTTTTTTPFPCYEDYDFFLT